MINQHKEDEYILLTGGTGYIGSHCAVEFLNLNYNIIIIDNFSDSTSDIIPRINNIVTNKNKLYWHQVDILNINDITSVFKLYPNISCVIHLAGCKSIYESMCNPLKYYQNNVQGIINLLLIMEKFNINKFIFSSSATVYGIPKALPLKETSDLNPINPCGQSKLICEQILSDISKYNNKIKIIILRHFNPIGAHQSGKIGKNPKNIPNNLISYITQVAIGKFQYLNIFGNDYSTFDGTGIRDYIHIVDLAKGHIAAYNRLNENECKNIEIYNLGIGKGYSVFEILNEMSNVVGFQIPYKICKRRLGDIDELYADISLANNKLKWKPELGLKQMCHDAWNWQKNNTHNIKI